MNFVADVVNRLKWAKNVALVIIVLNLDFMHITLEIAYFIWGIKNLESCNIYLG